MKQRGSFSSAVCSLTDDSQQQQQQRQVSICNFFGKKQPRSPLASRNIAIKRRKRKQFGSSGSSDHTAVEKKAQSKLPSHQQMYLDFGQTVNKQTTCPTCGMLYDSLGIQDDLQQHQAVCQPYRLGVPFAAKKSGRFVNGVTKGEVF